MRYYIALLIFVLLIPVTTLYAQGPTRNLCDDGQEWAGKCSSNQDWVNGWYAAGFLDGVFDLSEIPVSAQIQLKNAGFITFTYADNMCYRPGRICTSAWEWNSGWYVAQVENGALSREQVPQEYQIALPPPPPDPIAPRTLIGCADWFGTITICQYSDNTVDLSGAVKATGLSIIRSNTLDPITLGNTACAGRPWFNITGAFGRSTPPAEVVCN